MVSNLHRKHFPVIVSLMYLMTVIIVQRSPRKGDTWWARLTNFVTYWLIRCRHAILDVHQYRWWFECSRDLHWGGCPWMRAAFGLLMFSGRWYSFPSSCSGPFRTKSTSDRREHLQRGSGRHFGIGVCRILQLLSVKIWQHLSTASTIVIPPVSSLPNDLLILVLFCSFIADFLFETLGSVTYFLNRKKYNADMAARSADKSRPPMSSFASAFSLEGQDNHVQNQQ